MVGQEAIGAVEHHMEIQRLEPLMIDNHAKKIQLTKKQDMYPVVLFVDQNSIGHQSVLIPMKIIQNPSLLMKRLNRRTILKRMKMKKFILVFLLVTRTANLVVM